MKIEYAERGMGFPRGGDLLADFDNDRIYRVLPDTEGTGNILTHGPGMPNTVVLNVEVVECAGWTGEEGESDGYNVWDYFDDDGSYNGPDLFGVEPIFVPVPVDECLDVGDFVVSGEGSGLDYGKILEINEGDGEALVHWLGSETKSWQPIHLLRR